MEFDPFGYYKPRLLAGRHPVENFPYYEDYPMIDSHWDLWETFGGIFVFDDYDRNLTYFIDNFDDTPNNQ